MLRLRMMILRATATSLRCSQLSSWQCCLDHLACLVTELAAGCQGRSLRHAAHVI